jgi:hypothetical protein
LTIANQYLVGLVEVRHENIVDAIAIEVARRGAL